MRVALSFWESAGRPFRKLKVEPREKLDKTGGSNLSFIEFSRLFSWSSPNGSGRLEEASGGFELAQEGFPVASSGFESAPKWPREVKWLRVASRAF